MAYKHSITIPFEDADPAGIVFFARYFNYTHQAIEAMAHNNGLWENWFNNSDIGVPLKHVSADYMAPLFPGKTYTVAVTLERIGESSLSFMTEILADKTTIDNNRKEHIICAKIKTVHVFVAACSGKKIAVPRALREKFEG